MVWGDYRAGFTIGEGYDYRSKNGWFGRDSAVSMGALGPATNAQTNAGTTSIRNVRIFDGEKVIPRGSVLITGAQITAVGLDLAAPSGATTVDGTGKTLLPGLDSTAMSIWSVVFLPLVPVRLKMPRPGA